MHARILVAALAAVLLAGCTSSARTNDSQTSHGSGTPTGSSVGAAGCRPPSPITSGPMGPEVEGTGHGASLYGLLMMTDPAPVRAGEDVKIVWRMTGTGALRLLVNDPTGAPAHLVWGPEAHGGSNYDRPGDEYGAGYRFGAAGCWHLQARRGAARADVWLQVVR